ncbi:unnamed protein product [Spirodela intermedia]|uniref:Uncharacterized protein n=1 Tax=Spirodela intermedia TaxID=51605 RepID=A0A7I8I9R2_SPIIN|nr:unnamed protein product [Spirodela intermedia]CAA6654330.1 unnamed protein product [Spirodela intermedia]
MASQRKQEGNQGLMNNILMPKIIVEKTLSGVHQDHHKSSITRPKTSTQQGLCKIQIWDQERKNLECKRYGT